MSAPYDYAVDAGAFPESPPLRSPLPGREGQSLWWYQVELLPIVGYVWATAEDTARAAAEDDATFLATGYVGRGEWQLTPIHAR